MAVTWLPRLAGCATIRQYTRVENMETKFRLSTISVSDQVVTQTATAQQMCTAL